MLLREIAMNGDYNNALVNNFVWKQNGIEEVWLPAKDFKIPESVSNFLAL